MDGLKALAALGAFPYFVGFDSGGVHVSAELSAEDAQVLDLTAYRLKKFPMAQGLK